MNISKLFICRPIGTTLLAIGLMLLGFSAYRHLPVASLPNVDIPTIVVSASQPGANPETIAATIAAPLERSLGTIAGINEMTSTSSIGSTRIILQFDLSRNVVAAARDVQSAINAAASDLPSDIPSPPVLRKFNPNSMPVLILALTSDTMDSSSLFDIADSVIAQRIAQQEGVAQVQITGADQPAIHVLMDPNRLASLGVSLENIRTTIVNANTLTPLGVISGQNVGSSIEVDGQLLRPQDYSNLVIANSNGLPIVLSAAANIQQGERSNRSFASFNGKAAALMLVTKQPDANVIDVVDSVMALLPTLKQFIPAAVSISILSDRTPLIRASVDHMQSTILITILLVMIVVFIFLRRWPTTLAAGITVPLSLAGTATFMRLFGFSLDNLSLMALAIAVGFVVDDAIVVIENIERDIAQGKTPRQAALSGTQHIGFTIITISLSLIAAFIPLLFIGGIIGLFFREFALTLAFAIFCSAVISLTLTPVICAYLIHPMHGAKKTHLDRLVETALKLVLRFYSKTLDGVLNHRFLTLLTLVAAIAMTFGLFKTSSFALIPNVESGLISGFSQAASDISFPAMKELQNQAARLIAEDPAVAGVGSIIDAGRFGSTINSGQFFISLKPPEAREYASVNQIIGRLRKSLNSLIGLRVFIQASSDFRMGGRSSNANFQFTLWDPNVRELLELTPQVVDSVKAIPGLTDVTTDQQANGLQVEVVVDRIKADRLGVSVRAIDAALNDAFSARQISILYDARNQYRVVLEVRQQNAKDPIDITKIYVPGANNTQIPLSGLANLNRTIAPLAFNHQGQFPAITISYNVNPELTNTQAIEMIQEAVAKLHLPDGIHTDFAGDAKQLAGSPLKFLILFLTALVTIYIVLGILYESLIQPITILSTLVSACLGALVALRLSGTELSIIAMIGIILLIGIVQKNGIMLVDFALHAQRDRHLPPIEAIKTACIERFRPILMTTVAALLGALPMILTQGAGIELRYPLGVTIAGGLLLSQLLTLYTTPVVYLVLANCSLWVEQRRHKKKFISS